jgi:hypothetical protein
MRAALRISAVILVLVVAAESSGQGVRPGSHAAADPRGVLFSTDFAMGLINGSFDGASSASTGRSRCSRSVP